VQAYQDRVSDPVLQEQVRRFIYQEAMHTSVHQRCNKALIATYPKGPKIERMGGMLLNFFRRITPKPFHLAISCAIEHYTAMLADSLFTHDLDNFIKRAHPDFAQLWTWHAIEETEHKAVCFDVYRTVIGRGLIAYLTRVIAMLLVTLFGAVAVTIGVVMIGRDMPPQHQDKVGEAPKEKRNTAELFWSLIPWKLWFDYFRPTFHPWDHDNRHLVDLWKQRFPNFGHSPDAIAE
jgi:predicted metal-dependent hydrolase